MSEPKDTEAPEPIEVEWYGKPVKLTSTGNPDQWAAPGNRCFLYKRSDGWLAVQDFHSPGPDPQAAVAALEESIREELGEQVRVHSVDRTGEPPDNSAFDADVSRICAEAQSPQLPDELLAVALISCFLQDSDEISQAVVRQLRLDPSKLLNALRAAGLEGVLK